MGIALVPPIKEQVCFASIGVPGICFSEKGVETNSAKVRAVLEFAIPKWNVLNTISELLKTERDRDGTMNQ